jgi:hypothetical protein
VLLRLWRPTKCCSRAAYAGMWSRLREFMRDVYRVMIRSVVHTYDNPADCVNKLLHGLSAVVHEACLGANSRASELNDFP